MSDSKIWENVKALSLRQIIRKVDNIIADKLTTFSLGTSIGDMPLSLETFQLITERNRVTHMLRASLKADRKKYRDRLRETKKELD